MAKFNFYLRTPSGDRATPIKFVLSYEGQRLTLPTGETILPSLWDAERQRAKNKRNAPELADLNGRLNSMEATARAVLSNYLLNHGHAPTEAALRRLLNEQLDRTPKADTKPAELFAFLEACLQDAASRTGSKGKPLTQTSLRVYRRACSVLREYQQLRYKRRPFGFETIDADPTGFYNDYRDFLTREKGFSTNTVGKNLKTLKTFLLEAQAQGLLKNFNPRRFKAIAEEADSIYLNESELDALAALDLSKNPRLDRVRDLFLVGCWTGLRFSDFSRIRPDSLTPDGRFFDLTQQKTGDRVKIPVSPVVRAVLGKYEGRTANSLPPAISNVKMNAYLKELGQLAELDSPVTVRKTKGGLLTTRTVPKWELLTTHVARRSFATNMVQRDYPVAMIMGVTGHKTEAMFWKYVKLPQPDRAEQLLRLMENHTPADRRGVFKIAV